MKREQLARDRLGFETKLGMNAAEAVVHQEHARAVLALTKVGMAAELDRDRLSKLFLPILGSELFQILFAKLHGEVATAVAATVT